MMKEVRDILSSILTGAVMKGDRSAMVKVRAAIDEVETAEAEIEGLKKELAAQDAINSLKGNTGGEYNATR